MENLTTIYTSKSWEKDGTFNASVGQEIEESIFWQFLDGISPRIYSKCYLEDEKATYFLEGEAYDHYGENGRARYMLFVKYNNKYYYFGLCEADKNKATKQIETIIKVLKGATA